MEPRQFGNYTLLERVSHGGMAEVFRAKSFGEAGFEREVALKLLLPSMASDQEFVDMLIDEAKIAGQLNHANIAQIFDLGVEDGRYFIVQEFVQGQDLRAILKHRSTSRTKLKISTACHIAIKVCEGLHYAHNKQDHHGKRLNLVHRDISPHNILISDEGEVKIIDFGIAKADGRSTQTMAGLVKGKFAYMSPEQIRGLPVDHRSDVFATGILLHEMLTCRPLFQAGTEFETLKRARAAKADPPSQLNAEIPAELDAIVLKALARHVDDRYQSAREFRDDLWAFARANNAFAGHAQLAGMKPQESADSGSSMQIELASEARKVQIEPPVARVATNLDSGPVDEETVTGEDFAVREYSDVGPSVTPSGGGGYDSDYGDDDDDDDSENRTVVDPHFAGIAVAGEENADLDDAEDDFDAQWAADISGPLSGTGAEPSAPSKSHALPRVPRNPLDEETTSNRGSSPHERKTSPFMATEPAGIDEITAQGPLGRASTMPAQPSSIAKTATKTETDSPYAAATTTKRDRRIALAQTEPISTALLAQAPSVPASHNHPSAAQVGQPRRSAPAPAQQHGSQPAPMPQSQQHGSQPAPMPQSQQHGSQPAPMPMPQSQQHGSQPAPMPQSQQHGSQPAPMPQSQSQQHGSQPAPMPQQPYVQPYGGAPMQSSQQYGSQPVPMPRSDSGSAPNLMPPSDSGIAPLSQSGQAPLQDSGLLGADGAEAAQPRRRIYFVMTALFFLLLAAAATLTLVITE